MIPEPAVKPVTYMVSCLPPESINYEAASITVEWRGDDRFAVLRHRRCLSQSGAWDYESGSSSSTDDWIATHQFDLNTALRLAREQAPLITVNGHTVADVLAHEESGTW